MDSSFINAVENCRLTMPAKKVLPIGAKQLNVYLRDKNKILFAAKGPSLNHIDKFKNYTNYATVNEACCKIDGTIDFAFFFDKNALLNSFEAWERINHFVMPAYLFDDGTDDPPIAVASIKNLAKHKVIFFEEDQDDFVYEKIVEKINHEKLLTVDTAIMGLHFLVLMGFQEIFLLGHDGGVGYADGVPCLCANRDMQGFRDRINFCRQKFAKKYQIKITFFDEI